MKKQRWIYIGEGGKRSTIGIIHNTSKGQFMIYCNKKIVLVEFKLYDSKQFSFFLDEELCIVNVIKTENDFEYEFKVDLETATPLNIERKAMERSDRIKSIVGILVGLLVIALIIGGGVLIHQQHLKKQRKKHGVFAVATISIYPKAQSYSLSYSFPTTYSEHFHQVEYYKSPNPMSPNGFPFYDGDKFYVQYSKFSSDNHEIFYNRPTEEQIDRYKERTKEAHMKLNPSQNESYCMCLLNAAYDIKGLEGLLYFYHQKKAPFQNQRFNLKKYKEFTLTQAFREETQKCNELVQ